MVRSESDSEKEDMKKEVLVVGIPRSGTTYVFRSLAGLPEWDGTPKGRELEKLPIMKAHSLAPPESFGDPWAERVRRHVEEGRKVIFLFGDPILSVASTVRFRYDSVHAKNCGCFLPLSQISLYERDYFNYERMFDSWMNTDRARVLCLKYEKLPEIRRKGIVESFLGRKVRWLPWRPRVIQYCILYKGEIDALRSTYRTLERKYLTAPDVMFRNL